MCRGNLVSSLLHSEMGVKAFGSLFLAMGSHRVFFLCILLGKLWELSCGRLNRRMCAHSEIKLHKNVAGSGAGIFRNVPAPVLMKGKVSSSRAC